MWTILLSGKFLLFLTLIYCIQFLVFVSFCCQLGLHQLQNNWSLMRAVLRLLCYVFQGARPSFLCTNLNLQQITGSRLNWEKRTCEKTKHTKIGQSWTDGDKYDFEMDQEMISLSPPVSPSWQFMCLRQHRHPSQSPKSFPAAAKRHRLSVSTKNPTCKCGSQELAETWPPCSLIIVRLIYSWIYPMDTGGHNGQSQI